MTSAVIEISMTYFLVAGILVIAWAIAFITTRRKMLAEIDLLRSMIYEHVQREREAAKVTAPAKLPPVADAPLLSTSSRDEEKISEQTLALISAAVAAYLGKTARIRSARRLQADELSTWAQQGRVYVQASHNLGLSHHA
jgi:methylmalonyl-CoA carboxyltransferase large subunit